jgi:hypothetical protein
MKHCVLILFALSLTFPFACREEAVLPDLEQKVTTLEQKLAALERKLAELEGDTADLGAGQAERDREIAALKDSIDKLQRILALQAAYAARKQIVSATETTIGEADYRVITFSDYTVIPLPASIIESLFMDEATGEYIIELSDGLEFVFNRKDPVYPTGIVLLTRSLTYLRGAEVMFEFRVNPSNASFNYDLSSEDCSVFLDRIGEAKSYASYIAAPENYRLVKIEPSTDDDGRPEEGQYRAYIRDEAHTEGYKDDIALALSFIDPNGERVHISSPLMTLERKRSSGLPVVVIRTDNEKKILDKTNWIDGTMTISGLNPSDSYEGRISIRGRGNATWVEFPKKPYAIRLENKDSLLNMPAHNRWVLLANYRDRTLLRNHIALEIARRTELEWTPGGQFVELMLNDVSLGNYYLCEQIKIDENRLNITGMTPSDLSEESITGGYLMEFDSYFDEPNKFRSEVRDLPVMFQDPDEGVLQPAQFEYMQNYINRIESLLYEDETFPQNREYASMLDEASFIDWWLVMELTENLEARIPHSCYFNKARNGLLKAGPVWDFDYSTFVGRDYFTTDRALWYYALFRDPVFTGMAKERWALLKPRFEEVIPLIEEAGQKLQESEILDSELWPSRNAAPYNNGDEMLSHREAYLLMKNNYTKRIAWLDLHIRGL